MYKIFSTILWKIVFTHVYGNIFLIFTNYEKNNLQTSANKLISKINKTFQKKEEYPFVAPTFKSNPSENYGQLINGRKLKTECFHLRKVTVYFGKQ